MPRAGGSRRDKTPDSILPESRIVNEEGVDKRPAAPSSRLPYSRRHGATRVGICGLSRPTATVSRHHRGRRHTLLCSAHPGTTVSVASTVPRGTRNFSFGRDELQTLCQELSPEAAVSLLDEMLQHEGSGGGAAAELGPEEQAAVLQACANTRSLAALRRVHRLLSSTSGSVIPAPVLHRIATLYVKLGARGDARRVLDGSSRWPPQQPGKGNEEDAAVRAKRREAYEKVRGLHEQIRSAGYVPDTSHVMHDIDEDAKARALMYHSERLAIAFGLVSTPPGTPLRVTKNLRICGDCHNAVKLIAKVTGREMVVRDNKLAETTGEGPSPPQLQLTRISSIAVAEVLD
ncbi:uncharacterized protein LOC133910782 [Phragmites australis]|uniref:uncharacterized protein LOC133910782 n=1 Tax=Phragmites australis TaxID=29695 RepID=UPI002D7733C3|nr:uncharacterized protein LOC133910782 [Phragmites australis]